MTQAPGGVCRVLHVLINPDNPSGNYISKKEIKELLLWSSKKVITLIVDESFCDFIDKEEDYELIKEEIINSEEIQWRIYGKS